MVYRKQGLSRTLPKNFTFPSARAETPRTPERSSIHLDAPPPPPRPASFRLRRSRVRSGTDVFAQAESDFTSWNPNNYHSDTPLPSIELPPSSHDATVDLPCDEMRPTGSDHFLAPPQDRTALKTPPAQIRATPIELSTTGTWSAWDQQASGEAIQRPGSACSHASDSSVSSIETFASRRSMGGSCTSTESDLQDPFFYLELPKKPVVETTPLPMTDVEIERRSGFAMDRWTVEMDSHLWNTYQSYIQDPTMTPFKMTPGSIPPLGVTHRVAREARKGWDRKAFNLNRQFPFGLPRSQDGSATPTPKANGAAKKPTWPRSEASTRRRLKLLCRRKFSIAPHYQRLMLSRSPTPLMDSSSRESSSFEGPEPSSTAFTTRDLGMSLVSNSVPEPLAQLAAPDPPQQNTHVDWFNHPVNSGGPKEPTTLADSVAKRSLGLDRPGMAPRLGSPFNYHTWGPDHSKRRVHRHAPMGRRETIHVTGYRLRSPPRMDLMSSMNSNQTGQQDPFNSTTQETNEPDAYSHLEEFACQGKLNDSGNRRVRIRNRGATTSAVNTRALHQLFSPPSSSSKNETTPREKPMVNHHRRNLSGDSIKRLGSPFKMDGARRPQSSSGRFIRHAASSSDPFSNGQLSQSKPLPQSQHEGAMGVLPHDPTEPGLSDAERIRRQIMNMPYSRR